jgi:hypothetical protein
MAISAILWTAACAATIARMEPWEPADDLTLIMRTLVTLDAKLDEIVGHVVAVRSLLEDDEEEEEED